MTQLILSNNAAGQRIHDSILRSISQIALLIKQFTVKQHVISGRRSLMCAPQLLTAGGGASAVTDGHHAGLCECTL